MSKITSVFLPVFMLLIAGPASAYVGPGAGISLLGSLLSIVATVFVAIGAILLWPLRNYMKRRKIRREAVVESERSGGDSQD